MHGNSENFENKNNIPIPSNGLQFDISVGKKVGGKKKKRPIRGKHPKQLSKRKSIRRPVKNKKTIYFDNNGTTLICLPAKRVATKWLECYNASSDAKVSNSAKRLLNKSKEYMHKHCGTGGDDNYVVLFTSGATESNCTIIRMIIEAYHRNMFEIPHVVTSEIEHHSILACLEGLEENKRVHVTYLKPTIYGVITPESVKNAINSNKNTCLVTIMYANNEIGSCNNISEIAKVTHEASSDKFRIPFHTDAVQIFGKYQIKVIGEDKKGLNDIDALSMSFHKLYGPKGVGLLLIKKNIVDGFGLNALINGSQQYGLRGGTEDIPGIAGSIEALKHTFTGRTKKNKDLLRLKKLMLDLLAKKYKISDYKDYLDDSEFFKKNSSNRDKIELILLGPPNHERKVMPNTILLAIAKNHGKPFCNIRFKNKLSRENIVVSTSSTCLTKQKTASHVMDAIQAPPIIKNGVIRISLGDYNTEAEVRKFVKIFIRLLSE